jgi:hypothetical protein
MLKWIKDLLLKLMGLKYTQYIPKKLNLKYFKNDLSEFDSPDEVGSGIGKSFVHCDVDKLKDKDVIWLY